MSLRKAPAKPAKAKTRPGKAAVPRRATEAKGSDDEVAADVLLPLAGIALRLIEDIGERELIYIAADERRADEIGRILQRLAPMIETLVFPPWDCLPFDRASPSRDSMGRRVAVLQRLAAGTNPSRIVVTTVDAVLQRTPPPGRVAETFGIATGDPLDVAELAAFAERVGYGRDERVDEPGEIEFHGQVIEVFPPGAPQPFRVGTEGGAVIEISTFDPVSQRSTGRVPQLSLGPASELVVARGADLPERAGGWEHRLAEFYDDALPSLLDAMPDAIVFAAPATEAHRLAFLSQLEEAHSARATIGTTAEDTRRPLPAWDRLYLTEGDWQDILPRHEERGMVGQGTAPAPNFSAESEPVQAFQAFLSESQHHGTTVVLAGVARDLAALGRFLERHGGTKPTPVADWTAVRKAGRGAFLCLEIDLDEGIVLTAARITLVAAADVLGTRAHRESQRDAGARGLLAPPAIRIGDTVIHEDHGIGILRGLEQVEIDGETQDAVRLEYHGGQSLLAPVRDLDRLWRYGSEDEVVSLDRLHTEAWAKRRIEIERAVIETATQLVALASERESRAAPKLIAPRRAYETFAARFPFPETPDQARAIAAVTEDLGSGRPMDRLVCGDVGFGKTEVALRAAAIALMGGAQVALMAPTTVLARQHLATFRKRFAGLGFEIAGLSRLETSADNKEVKQGLANGSIRMVIGTHAVAGAGVEFDDLGLLIIDEEQKFGAKLKAELRGKAAGGHVLTLTATPIPRTLQMAMVGIQAVSVIATPPVRRRPIRTFVVPFDPASVRIALTREQARGGQSFVIVPRIEDIDAMRAKLHAIVPELSVLVAHGDLPVEEADRAMVGFAQGDGDVLLATNIVESGLDVPRANTMLVWHADRFGLSQLHQLRGRVGRGRAQGVAYLLSEPDAELGGATLARLATLQSFDRLGSGFEISARDLDLRGAGNLVGDEQAGHMKLIGLGLYQRLLARAVRHARGETVDDDAAPELHVDGGGRIPESFVAEPELRIDLYARLSRLGSAVEIQEFEEEIEDRFGTLPEDVVVLLALARLRTLCRRLHVAALNAGPRGVALTLRPAGLARGTAAAEGRSDVTLKGSKLIWAVAAASKEDCFARAEEFLAMLSETALRTPAAA